MISKIYFNHYQINDFADYLITQIRADGFSQKLTNKLFNNNFKFQKEAIDTLTIMHEIAKWKL